MWPRISGETYFFLFFINFFLSLTLLRRTENVSTQRKLFIILGYIDISMFTATL